MIVAGDIVVVVLALAYGGWILYLWVGWRKKIAPSEPSTAKALKTSVVIAFRNEASNLEALCQDLLNLDYAKDAFEVILIDDDSTDGGADIISRKLEGKIAYRVLQSDSLQPGKKFALTTGIAAARFDWIVTTDADCRLSTEWLKLLSVAQSQRPNAMWCGRVFYSGTTWWDSLLQHEFATVIGTGAATLQLGHPTMCNGANLAFQKSWFQQVGGYTSSAKVASGDDEFLMHRIFTASRGGVAFLNQQRHTVYTAAPGSLGAFFRQRIRWASKWQHYQSNFVKVFALLTFALQSAYLVLPIAALLGWISGSMCAIAWGVKILADGIFMHSILKDFERRLNFFILLCLEVFYPFYVVTVGLISRFLPYSWKGRKWK